MIVFNFRDLTNILRKNGYELVRTNGSHHYYSNGNNNVAVPIRLKPIISTKIVKQYQLTS
ncbi:MAG: type II toxin-antitoxin system HicA family toxin [Oscillospiraceae bacterium]